MITCRVVLAAGKNAVDFGDFPPCPIGPQEIVCDACKRRLILNLFDPILIILENPS